VSEQGVFFQQNQYVGVNAHLQSQLQRENGGWSMFHSSHIVHLTDFIDRILPENYYASVEASLQIKTRIEPDVLIAQRPPLSTMRGNRPVATVVEHNTYVITQEFTEEEYYRAIVVYQLGASRDQDQPVTRIELLSPSNKPPYGSHQDKYEDKREETLAAGLNMVEIDYLHESPPIRPVSTLVPNYAVKPGETRDPKAAAYHVVVTRPQSIEARKATLEVATYLFGVDSPMPTIGIPLKGSDLIALNLGEVYNYTFESQRRWGYSVDYTQFPPAYDTYSPADQERIAARMKAAREAYRNNPATNKIT